MIQESDLADISRLLLRTDSRRASDRATRQRKADRDSLVRLRRGIYVPTPTWRGFSEEDRHLAKLVAMHEAANTSPVFSHLTAAVVHGLPIYGPLPTSIHVTGTPASANTSTPQIVRHRSTLHSGDVIDVAGVRCTSLEHTLIDIALTAPAEVALAAIDGHLRREFRVGHHVDWERFFEWRAEMLGRLAARGGARGIRQGRMVFALADPRKDSVLESVSHLQLHRLGFEVELQVPVRSPKHSTYYVDFEFVGLNLFGECDGKDKYVNALLRAGLSAEEVVYREKRRQDWICGTTKKDLIRWGYPDVVTPLALARRLQAFGVAIPRMPKQGRER